MRENPKKKSIKAYVYVITNILQFEPSPIKTRSL